MLQLMGQTAQPVSPAADVMPQSDRFSTLPVDMALPAVQADFATALESVDELLAEPPMPNEATASVELLPLQPDSLPQASAEPDAEQWLLSMLGQRASTIQTRDGEQAPAANERVATDDPGAAMQTFGLPLATIATPLPAPDPGPATKADTVPPQVVGLDVAQPKIAPLPPDTSPPEPLGSSPERISTEASLGTPGGTAQAVTPAAMAERVLKLQGPEHRWGEQMLHALRENVELQVQQRVQSATIRLDPPELGSMEIFLSHESGRLSIHITASQTDVARLLQNTSERLRQELLGQAFTQVSVGVSSDGQSGRQHSQQSRSQVFEADAVLAANSLEENRQADGNRRQGGVLVTV